MAIVGLIFVAAATGCLTNAAYGCLTFGAGLISFAVFDAVRGCNGVTDE